METNNKTATGTDSGGELTCGLVMPISAIDGLGADHWTEVKAIIIDAVDSIATPKFVARLVSDADDVGIIQKRIVQGIYSSDIVICDVSARNPNVMFELGMRLAFDRPTVIVKDDKTDYVFDMSIIEHIPYPRDLRFSKIVSFKRQLAEKVAATFKASNEDPAHSTFLKSFGTFKVAHLQQTVGSQEQVMMEMLQDIQQEVARLRRSTVVRSSLQPRKGTNMEEGKAVMMSLLLNGSDLTKTGTEAINDLRDSLEKAMPAHRYFESKNEFDDAFVEVLEKVKRTGIDLAKNL